MLYVCIMLVLIIDYKIVNEDSCLMDLAILEIEVEQNQSKHERQHGFLYYSQTLNCIPSRRFFSLEAEKSDFFLTTITVDYH